METFNTALYINTLSRSLEVFSVQVTKTITGELVLRHGLALGRLTELTDLAFRPNMPIIIPTQGYTARSSEGMVEVLKPGQIWGPASQLWTVVGMLGFPWQGHSGLAKLKNPQNVLIINPEAEVLRRQTHENSNAGTAKAALDGARLLSNLKMNSTFIIEGQSDYITVFEVVIHSMRLKTLEEKGEWFEPDWELEHSKLFAPASSEKTEDRNIMTSDVFDFGDDDEDEDLLGATTLAKLRNRNLQFKLED